MTSFSSMSQDFSKYLDIFNKIGEIVSRFENRQFCTDESSPGEVLTFSSLIRFNDSCEDANCRR